MSEREDRFGELYARTCARIVAFAVRRTSSPEDAADVVAQTFEIAWRKFDEIPSGEPGLLWLYVTTRYVLANHHRRLRRRDMLFSNLVEDLKRVSIHSEALDEEALVMQACLRSLAEDDREILLLTAWEGLGASELGRVLGCSQTAARIRLHRARSRLRGAIARMEDPKRSRSHQQEDVGEMKSSNRLAQEELER